VGVPSYDHDETGRLIEDYWNDEWPKVEKDFRERRRLGANVVRIHLQALQVSCGARDAADPTVSCNCQRLLKLAEDRGSISISRPGLLHKKDVPDCTTPCPERERWDVQALFWEAVAKQCEGSPAIFCYDLMTTGRVRRQTQGGRLAGPGFPPAATLSSSYRSIPAAARGTRSLPMERTADPGDPQARAAAPGHCGLVDWSLDSPGADSGFVPDKIAEKQIFCAFTFIRAGQVTKP